MSTKYIIAVRDFSSSVQYSILELLNERSGIFSLLLINIATGHISSLFTMLPFHSVVIGLIGILIHRFTANKISNMLPNFELLSTHNNEKSNAILSHNPINEFAYGLFYLSLAANIYVFLPKYIPTLISPLITNQILITMCLPLFCYGLSRFIYGNYCQSSKSFEQSKKNIKITEAAHPYPAVNSFEKNSSMVKIKSMISNLLLGISFFLPLHQAYLVYSGIYIFNITYNKLSTLSHDKAYLQKNGLAGFQQLKNSILNDPQNILIPKMNIISRSTMSIFGPISVYKRMIHLLELAKKQLSAKDYNEISNGIDPKKYMTIWNLPIINIFSGISGWLTNIFVPAYELHHSAAQSKTSGAFQDTSSEKAVKNKEVRDIKCVDLTIS